MISKKRQLELVTQHQYTDLAQALIPNEESHKKAKLEDHLTITLDDLLLYLRQNGLPDHKEGHFRSAGRYFVFENNLWKVYACSSDNQILPGSIYCFNSYERMLNFVARNSYIYKDKPAKPSIPHLGQCQIKFQAEIRGQNLAIFNTGSTFPGVLTNYPLPANHQPTTRLLLLSYKQVDLMGDGILAFYDYDGQRTNLPINLIEPEECAATIKARVESENPFRLRVLKRLGEIPKDEQLEAVVSNSLPSFCKKYDIKYGDRLDYLTVSIDEIAAYLNRSYFVDRDSGILSWKGWRLASPSEAQAGWAVYRTIGQKQDPGSILHFATKQEGLLHIVKTEFAQSLNLPGRPSDKELGQHQQTFEHLTDEDYFVELYRNGEEDLGSLYLLNNDQDHTLRLVEISLMLHFEENREHPYSLQLHTEDGASLLIERGVKQVELLIETLRGRLGGSHRPGLIKTARRPLSPRFRPLLFEFEGLKAGGLDHARRMYETVSKYTLQIRITQVDQGALQKVVDLLEAFLLDESLHYFYLEELAFIDRYEGGLAIEADSRLGEVRLFTRKPIPLRRPKSWQTRKTADLTMLAKQLAGDQVELTFVLMKA